MLIWSSVYSVGSSLTLHDGVIGGPFFVFCTIRGFLFLPAGSSLRVNCRRLLFLFVLCWPVRGWPVRRWLDLFAINNTQSVSVSNRDLLPGERWRGTKQKNNRGLFSVFFFRACGKESYSSSPPSKIGGADHWNHWSLDISMRLTGVGLLCLRVVVYCCFLPWGARLGWVDGSWCVLSVCETGGTFFVC